MIKMATVAVVGLALTGAAHAKQTKPFDLTCSGKRQTGEGMAGTVVGVCHLAANTPNEGKVQDACGDESPCEFGALVLGRYPTFEVVKILSVMGHPLMVQADENGDACDHMGRAKLKPSGFLSVRGAPEINGKEKDKIFNNQLVQICDGTESDDWWPIIYKKGPDSVRCHENLTSKKPHAYVGPCQFGWVNKKFLGDFSD